jgi:hypothetical protein
LNFYGNWILPNLDGLENLVSIGGGISIMDNPGMSYLDGLTSISGCIDHLNIMNNDQLESLEGLNNLDSIEGNFMSFWCHGIENFTGLNSLTYIGDEFQVWDNSNLNNFTGLENLNAISGSFNIIGNVTLENFTGLENLITINGSFSLDNNASLEQFTGLENLDTIGGSFSVRNSLILENFYGLDNLTAIGGDFIIQDNDSLLDFSGLENLTTIDGNIKIGCFFLYGNPLLTSLSGLDNVEGESIEDLCIAYNVALSTCHVQSVCDYLAQPNGQVNIHDNAFGCHSPTHVEALCNIGTGFSEKRVPQFGIHPNPTNNGIITLTLNNSSNKHLTCFNTFGQMVHQQEIHSAETVINVSTWAPGIYLVVVYGDGKVVGRARFVVQ